MKISELLVRIAADTKDFAGPLRTASGDLDKFSKSATGTETALSGFGRSLSGIGGALGITAGIAGLVEFGRAAIDARAKMDSLERGMIAVSGSAGKASIEIDRLREVAKLPGIGFQEAIQGSINLQSAGLSADLARRALGGFANALATVGKGKAELDGVNLALGQIATKGKVSAEEIKQLAERVPQIRQIMISAFGTGDTEAIQKMGISSKAFIEKIVTELEKLPKVTGGLQVDIENLGDAYMRMMSQIGKMTQPVVGAAIGLFTDLATSIENSVRRANELDEVFAKFDEFQKKNIAKNFNITSKDFAPLQGFNPGSLDEAEKAIKLWKQVDELNAQAEKRFSKAKPQAQGAGQPFTPQITWFDAEKAGPTKEQLDKWKKQQEDSIKETYQLWDKFAKDMEFLQKRPGLDIQIGVTPSRWHQELADAIRATDQMKALDKELADSKVDWSIRTQEALNAVRDKSKELIPVTQTTTGAIIAAWSGVAQGVGVVIASQVDRITKLREAYAKLGITMRGDLIRDIDGMREAMKRLEEQALDSATSAEEVAYIMERLADAEYKRRQSQREASGLGPMPTVNLGKKQKEDPIDKKAMQEISTVFDDLSHNLANLIIEGGKFKDAMVGAAKQIGTSFLRLVINEALRPVQEVMKQLAKAVVDLAGSIIKNLVQGAFKQLGASISGIIGGLGKIFGSTANAAGSVAGAASGAAGAVGGAASGAGGAASGVASAGIAGTVGMITGAISAVSGVIGNFQMMGMNKSLDILVKHTLQLVMQGEALRPLISERLVALHDRLMEFRQIGIRVFTTDAALAVSWAGAGPSGGGGGYTIQINNSSFIGFRDMDAFVDDLVRRIKARL